MKTTTGLCVVMAVTEAACSLSQSACRARCAAVGAGPVSEPRSSPPALVALAVASLLLATLPLSVALLSVPEARVGELGVAIAGSADVQAMATVATVTAVALSGERLRYFTDSIRMVPLSMFSRDHALV